MKYGLTEAQLEETLRVIASVENLKHAVLFGSRAIGNYKEASDVDIAIDGEGVDVMVASHLKYLLEEETFLPFFFDVVAIPTLEDKGLLEHIRTEGVQLWPQPENSKTE